ncbi:unnamed protein product [Penicillium salamii]|uniref:Uncharacterized protein n=1 Tax=Penicillium salamii TaxID=1612424 RepID=A0A9W4NPE9_9EURO|nr:unnamed protein product [Penicillium salamii]
MECISTRVPYAKWRLNTFRQLLRTSQPLTAHAVKRSISTSRQNKMNETTSKESSDTSDPNTIPPSQRLPQSPLITHPRPSRQKSRKMRPTSEHTSLLSKNPWAVALASPTRMCTITGARLPSDLLGTWGLVRQPGTALSYMLPVGLMQDSLTNKAPDNSVMEPELLNPGDEESAAEFAPPAIRNNRPGRQLVLRFTELLPLIKSITVPLSKKGGKKPPVMRLVPFRWKHPQGPVKPIHEKDLLWLENTPEILLRSMQSDVCKKLGAVLGKYKRVDVPNGVWRNLEMPQYSNSTLEEALGKLESFERIECGAVLLLGSKGATTDAGSTQAESALDSITLPQTGFTVPVFDLSTLLAESDLSTLRESHAQLEPSAVFFRPDDKAGITAMISLWKIKRLLAEIDL